MRLGLWVGVVAFLVATTAQAGSLGALKGELKRLEGVASEWAPLAGATSGPGGRPKGSSKAPVVGPATQGATAPATTDAKNRKS